MEELSVKIKIGDREYPMKVYPEDEARIRTAGKIINERIQIYKEQFGIDDLQDLLAMAAFDCVVDTLKQKDTTGDQALITNSITTLTQLIDQTLQTD